MFVRGFEFNGTYLVTELPSTLLDGLSHAWKFDESGVGVDAPRQDSIGSVHLTPTAELMIPASGKDGMSYRNDGSSGLLSADSAAMRDLVDGSFTFSCWIKLNNISIPHAIFGCWNTFGESDGSYVLRFAPASLRWILTTNGTTVTQRTIGSLSADTWYHVLCYYDKANNIMGISVDKGAGNQIGIASIHKSSAPFMVGAFGSASSALDNILNGQVDELYCWNRLLTPQEHVLLYNSGDGKYYPFE